LDGTVAQSFSFSSSNTDRTALLNLFFASVFGTASGGGFPLQLATSRSEDEAKALWKKVSQNQAVAGAQPQIEKVDIGNFGTFWSLRIGPFTDKAESLKVCNALKRSGIDCSPVTP